MTLGMWKGEVCLKKVVCQSVSQSVSQPVSQSVTSQSVSQPALMNRLNKKYFKKTALLHALPGPVVRDDPGDVEGRGVP